MDNERTVIITRFSALGDVAMTLPALYAVARSHPGVRFVLVTRSWMAPMAIDAPGNLTVHGVDLGRYKGVGGLWRLGRQLCRLYRPASWIDLHDVLRTKVLRNVARLCGAKVTVYDKGRREKKNAIKRRLSAPLTPTIERYTHALEKAGYASSELFAGLLKHTPQSTPRIGIAPFAAHRGKIYPFPLMKRLVEMIAGIPHAQVYVFGAGADECAAIDRMSRGLPNVTNMAALRKGLEAEIRLMATLDLMVTMDSGNMHLAAMAPTRTLSIWGATHPSLGFRAWNAAPDDTVGLDIDCRPCSVYGAKECRHGDYRCMARISPQTIFDHVCKILKEVR